MAFREGKKEKSLTLLFKSDFVENDENTYIYNIFNFESIITT